MLRAYRLMDLHLTEESCSLRMQRHHHEHGLGCRVIRMEKASFEGRREASRLAAVITSEMQRRIEAVVSLRRKWTWPCCSMLWDDNHAFGLPLEAPKSWKCFGPLMEKGDTVSWLTCAALDLDSRNLQLACSQQLDRPQASTHTAKTATHAPCSPEELGPGTPRVTRSSEWDLCDGGDGGDDGPSAWPCPSPFPGGSRPPPFWVPEPSPLLPADLPCPNLGLGPRPYALPKPFVLPICDCGFRPTPLGVPVCNLPVLGSGSALGRHLVKPPDCNRRLQ